MTEIVIGHPYPPEGSHVVTLYALVALPQDGHVESVEDPEFFMPTWAEELLSEVEEVIRKMALSYANIAILEGARTLAPKPEGTMDTPDLAPIVAAMGDEPLTPAELARKKRIDLDAEIIERQKEFHRLTVSFVMNRDQYNRVRSIMHEEEPPPGGWDSINGDMLNGYPIVIREDGGAPHLELVDKPLRPGQFAGVTSFGIERDFTPIPFADPVAMGGFSETEPAQSVHSGHEGAEEEDGDHPDAPYAPEH